MKHYGRDLKDTGFSPVIIILLIAVICITVAGFVFSSDFFVKSRAKGVVQWCRKWESAQLTYYFKRDRLAGDSNGNGVIADEPDPGSPLNELVMSKVIGKTQKKFQSGDTVFHMKIGFDMVKGRKRNVFVICPSSGCVRTLDQDEVALMEMIDSLMDGEVDAASGDIRGVAGVTLVADDEAVTDVREEKALEGWNDSSYVGAAYYFEDYQH